MLSPGEVLSLSIDKPAAGGRMIARANGQVVLVGGAIPGERVTARIERIGKGVAYAQAVGVEEPSPDRREPFTDALCGGCLYAHVAYPRQLVIKGEVVADAFARIARLPLDRPVPVAASPGEGYRMRARLHVRGGRIGFFREGTHELCDARSTRQLLPETFDLLARLEAGLRSLGAAGIQEIELSENVSASGRVVHLGATAPVDPRSCAPLALDGLTGLSFQRPGGPPATLSGDPHVSDELELHGRAVTLRRHVLAFFQGNRFLLPALVERVISAVPEGAAVVDLYAGAGLFSVPAAVIRGARVVAVEGDRIAARDLEVNARQAGGAVTALRMPVESFALMPPRATDVAIVDPPRTGLSREALAATIGLNAARLIYVSCDVATLARDARRLADAGYTLVQLDAFDLFPNTPHVETVAVFDRAG